MSNHMMVSGLVLLVLKGHGDFSDVASGIRYAKYAKTWGFGDVLAEFLLLASVSTLIKASS